MRARFDRFLAGSALALVLAAAPALAQTTSAPANDSAAPAQASEPAKPAAKPEDKPEAKTDRNAAVASMLREQIPAMADRLFGRRAERTAVEAFYKSRDFAPLWLTDGAANAMAKAAAGYLAQVDRDGLDPAEYRTPDFAAANDARALAEAELRLTAAALQYAHHALNGRVHYTRIASDISFSHETAGPDDVLRKLAAGDDAAKTLDGFQPQHRDYQELKKALADARAGKFDKKAEAEPKPAVRIPGGKVMKPGVKDERVVLLRKRLKIAENPDSSLYDDDVQKAVADFQKNAGIGIDGNVGPNTIATLNGDGPPAAKIGDPADLIMVNMDRWRWFQRELGDIYVDVNAPDYRLTVYKDGKVYWTTKIVVGKPSQATPMITSDMKFITVNPTWNVPPSIIENEYLPALQQDPQALERIGLKVEQAADGTVRIWQPPGAANALGRIRFNFPNKFLVYQHDTPDKHLFARDRRAFSHGCMRVENPLKYGEVLLSLTQPQENYTAARLEKMFGGSEININFPKSIPVHLTYQSAFVDGDGKLQLREDIYGRDARMLAILKGGERKVADIAIARPPNTSAKPVRVAPGSLGGAYSSGPGFFEFLFGGPARENYGPVRRRSDAGGRVSSR